ncbi:MAG: response regulator [Vicinamibacterales bacterium]
MRHKLLLADDSVTIQRVIELTFADEDIEVLVAGNGRQAIERVQADRPDIVLADVGMPERDGYEVAAFIKGNPELASIHVLLLTGAFEPLDENRARAAGCDGTLVKPFEPQLVINRVRELLARGPSSVRAQPSASGAAQAPGGEPPHPATPPSSGMPSPPNEVLPPVEPGAHREPQAVKPMPDPLEPPASMGTSLEDYFDRLDAAFANIGAPPPSHPAKLEHEEITAVVGEIDRGTPEAGRSARDPLTSWDPDITVGSTPARQQHLADAFAALLAAEQGQAPPQSAAAPPQAAAAPQPIAILEETIEEVVRRVIARMGEESMRQLVLDTAERLVREEIERIKRHGSSGGSRSGG